MHVWCIELFITLQAGHGLELLNKVVSLAVSIENGSHLACVALWLQVQCACPWDSFIWNERHILSLMCIILCAVGTVHLYSVLIKGDVLVSEVIL